MQTATQIPRPIKFHDHYFEALDQRELPLKEIYHRIETLEQCHQCIKDMIVRGAPLIGFTALYGLVLWAKTTEDLSFESLKKSATYLKSARPTAVNLEYELNRALDLLKNHDFASAEETAKILREFTIQAYDQLEKDNLSMAKSALAKLEELYPGKKSFRLMTLCNTGYLACGPIGTALGVISYLHHLERVETVFACETRPYLQGARLTSYELAKQSIPHSLIVEGAMSFVLQRQSIDAIFVGADRIAANGDTANKIGTSSLAIIAKHYGVPFFVVAPTSSFDTQTKSGDDIEIEMRPASEVTTWQGVQTAPTQTPGFNPSFDVTSAQTITGIFCEKGVISPVNENHLREVVEG